MDDICIVSEISGEGDCLNHRIIGVCDEKLARDYVDAYNRLYPNGSDTYCIWEHVNPVKVREVAFMQEKLERIAREEKKKSERNRKNKYNTERRQLLSLAKKYPDLVTING